MCLTLENTKSDTEAFVSTGRGSDRNSMAHTNKDELSESIAQGLVNSDQPKENQAGTWITTAPSGIQVGTKGAKRMDLKPLLIYQATNPADGTVSLFLCYRSTVY